MMEQILFDEHLSRRLLRYLPVDLDVTATTVRRKGWLSQRNGELLRLAAQAPDVDVLITADKAMLTQQNERTLPLPVIVLAPSRRHNETRASLMSGHVADLLRQDLDNRFYVVGQAPTTEREFKRIGKLLKRGSARGKGSDRGH